MIHKILEAIDDAQLAEANMVQYGDVVAALASVGWEPGTEGWTKPGDSWEMSFWNPKLGAQGQETIVVAVAAGDLTMPGYRKFANVLPVKWVYASDEGGKGEKVTPQTADVVSWVVAKAELLNELDPSSVPNMTIGELGELMREMGWVIAEVPDAPAETTFWTHPSFPDGARTAWISGTLDEDAKTLANVFHGNAEESSELWPTRDEVAKAAAALTKEYGKPAKKLHPSAALGPPTPNVGKFKVTVSDTNGDFIDTLDEVFDTWGEAHAAGKDYAQEYAGEATSLTGDMGEYEDILEGMAIYVEEIKPGGES